MVVTTIQKCNNAKVDTITINNRELFWVRMIDVQNRLCLKNMSDLVRKEIQGIFETKKPTPEQIRKYKSSEKEIEDDPESNFKIKYVCNDLMEKIIKNCRGVKQGNDGMNRTGKEEKRKSFRASLGLKGHDITMTEEYSITSKI